MSKFQSNKIASLLMVSACFTFATISIVFSFINQTISGVQIFFITNFSAAIIIASHNILSLNFHFFKLSGIKFYLARALLNNISTLLWFYLIRNTDINQMTALSYAAPILTSVMAIKVFKESFLRHRIMGILTCLIGMVFIVNPFTHNFDYDILLGFPMIFCWSLSDIIMKRQGKTENFINQSFYICLFNSLFAIIPVIIFWQSLEFVDFSLMQIIAMLLILNTGLLYLAYAKGEVNYIATFDFSRVAFTYILSYIFLGSFTHLNVLIGSLMILFSLIVTHIKEKELFKEINLP